MASLGHFPHKISLEWVAAPFFGQQNVTPREIADQEW
jgi:hypothetical protein